jgi:hypothetical protein
VVLWEWAAPKAPADLQRVGRNLTLLDNIFGKEAANFIGGAGWAPARGALPSFMLKELCQGEVWETTYYGDAPGAPGATGAPGALGARGATQWHWEDIIWPKNAEICGLRAKHSSTWGTLLVHASSNAAGEQLGCPAQFDEGLRAPAGLHFYMQSRKQFLWVMQEDDPGSISAWKIPGDLRWERDEHSHFQRFRPAPREKLLGEASSIHGFDVATVLWSPEPGRPGGRLPLALLLKKPKGNNFTLFHLSLVPTAVVDAVLAARATVPLAERRRT